MTITLRQTTHTERNNMLDKLTNEQLIRIIQWTLNDLNAWNNNKNGVLPEVKRFTGMFEEAVKYQVTKAINTMEEK